MTELELLEFSEAVGRVFDQEWRKARRKALTLAFMAGVLTTAAVAFIARLI